MLNPFARAIVYYGGGGFALLLLCAAVFLDPFTGEHPDRAKRLRRRALLLAPIGVLHPVIAGTALVLARDTARIAGTTSAGLAYIASSASLVASAVVMVVVLWVAA